MLNSKIINYHRRNFSYYRISNKIETDSILLLPGFGFDIDQIMVQLREINSLNEYNWIIPIYFGFGDSSNNDNFMNIESNVDAIFQMFLEEGLTALNVIAINFGTVILHYLYQKIRDTSASIVINRSFHIGSLFDVRDVKVANLLDLQDFNRFKENQYQLVVSNYINQLHPSFGKQIQKLSMKSLWNYLTSLSISITKFPYNLLKDNESELNLKITFLGRTSNDQERYSDIILMNNFETVLFISEIGEEFMFHNPISFWNKIIEELKN